MRNKYYNYEKNKIKDINEENRGGSNKTFTEKEEKEIFLCDDIIKIYANNKFKEINFDTNFSASNVWCYMFKKRWNLSTVKISISKIATTIYTEDEIKIFLNKCKDTLVKVGENFFST